MRVKHWSVSGVWELQKNISNADTSLCNFPRRMVAYLYNILTFRFWVKVINSQNKIKKCSKWKWKTNTTDFGYDKKIHTRILGHQCGVRSRFFSSKSTVWRISVWSLLTCMVSSVWEPEQTHLIEECHSETVTEGNCIHFYLPCKITFFFF